MAEPQPGTLAAELLAAPVPTTVRPTAPRYSYLLCDLLTDRPIARLPLGGVSFERRIGYAGTFSGQMALPDARSVELAKSLRAYVGRSALYAFRDGRIWWGGICWTAQAKGDDRGNISLDLNAATFESYADHRYIRSEMPTVDQRDQGLIVVDYWRHLQDVDGGDIGVSVGDDSDYLTGTLRDRDAEKPSAAQTYGNQLQELSEVEGGPEWTIDLLQDSATNERSKRLRVGAPLGAGRDPVQTFTRSDIISWSEPTDAVDGGTSFQTRGSAPEGNAAEEQEPLMSTIYDAEDLLDRGWPVLDVAEDFTTVEKVSTLNEHARGLRERRSGSQRTHAYTVTVVGSSWQPNQIGLPVKIRQDDLWHSPATTKIVRPVGYKVTAADRDQTEKVELIFDDEEV